MAKSQKNHDSVAALAGRRIDAADSKESRFPLGMVPAVKKALSDLFIKEDVRLLICSAACGADLLALDAALKAGIRCRVILPFEINRFRQTSVVDRPGDWGPLFDRIISLVKSNGDLVMLKGGRNANDAYQQVNKALIVEAKASLKPRHLAIVVWEGHPRTKDDATAEFRLLAKDEGMQERIVPTLCN